MQWYIIFYLWKQVVGRERYENIKFNNNKFRNLLKIFGSFLIQLNFELNYLSRNFRSAVLNFS
jgi:hypothetical protein